MTRNDTALKEFKLLMSKLKITLPRWYFEECKERLKNPCIYISQERDVINYIRGREGLGARYGADVRKAKKLSAKASKRARIKLDNNDVW